MKEFTKTIIRLWDFFFSVFSVFLFKLFAWDCETEMVKNARWERGLWGKDAL